MNINQYNNRITTYMRIVYSVLMCVSFLFLPVWFSGIVILFGIYLYVFFVESILIFAVYALLFAPQENISTLIMVVFVMFCIVYIFEKIRPLLRN